jgi:hypothetical protein
MRIGLPSDDERFGYLRTFARLMKLEVDYYTHRHAIPKRDESLLGLLHEWAHDFDVIVLPLTFSHFGSLRIAELVHAHAINLGLLMYSASEQLSKDLALPLFDAFLDARQIEPELKKYVSADGGILGPYYNLTDTEGPFKLARAIQAALDAAITNKGERISKASLVELLISKLLTTQGCFTYDIYSGRHPELALRASIVDYQSRLYLEDQIKQFPGGARQHTIDEWKHSQLTIIGNVTMSEDRIHISNVVGSVNVKARLDHVVQIVRQAPEVQSNQKDELSKLLLELEAALEPIAEKDSEDSARVVDAAEMVAKELAKRKPSRSFLKVTAEGLMEAAKAVATIAPGVLDVASKIAKFVVDLS